MLEYSLKDFISNNEINSKTSIQDSVRSYAGTKAPLFCVIKHSARAHREVRPTNTKHIQKCLRTLALFTKFIQGSGIEWYLTGGIAIDLVKMTSFREHGDLDIVLSINEAPKLAKFLEKREVYAYRRVCTATYHADNRLTAFQRCLPSESDFGKMRNLKLFMGPKESVLPFVDIHFVKPVKLGNSLLGDKKVITLPFPVKGKNNFLVNGNKITCCDLRLIYYLKSDANPRNYYDAKRIAAELSPSEAAEVLEYRAANFAPILQGHIASHTPHNFQTESLR